MKKRVVMFASACSASALVTVLVLLAVAQDRGAPQLAQAVAPSYPTLALYSGTTGTVKVDVAIDASGSVTSAKAVEGPELLKSTSEAAAKAWRFETGSGSSMAQLVFTFKIMPKDAPEGDLSPRFMPPYHFEVRHIVPEPMTNRDPAPDVLR